MDGQTWIAGLQIGAVYALLGIGFVCAYSGTRCVNFAQGEFAMLGGMLTASLLHRVHSSVVAASLFAITLTIIVGMLSYLVVVQWLQDRPLLSVLGTIGLAAAIRGAAALAWGRDVHSLPNFSPLPYVVLGGLSIPTQALWMLGALLVLSALLGCFLRGTLEGRAFAACSINPAGAALCGIPQLAIGLLAFGLASATGAVAGIVLAPVTFTSYDAGLGLGLRGFCSAATGGMRSLPLTVLGGVGLGLLESFSMRYVTSSYKDVIVFALLIAVLIANAGRLNRTLGEGAA